MRFSEYQNEAFKTEQPYMSGEDKLIVPLLGLAGETGELLSEYKKKLRDGADHLHFETRVAEELGDLLWYIANIAKKFNLDLDEIATQNLKKVRDRFGTRSLNPDSAPCFDSSLSDDERIPRKFTVHLFDTELDGNPHTIGFCGEFPLGDKLTDNSREDDGYRFHDAFHLGYAAVLGWSPVTRYLLGVKRKSVEELDMVEDGGRATAIEEGISALVHSYAEKQNFLAESNILDYRLLRTITDMTAKLEVRALTSADWQRAILAGYKVWRSLVENKSGVVHVDLDSGTIEYARPLTQDEITEHTKNYPDALKRFKEIRKQRKKRLLELRAAKGIVPTIGMSELN